METVLKRDPLVSEWPTWIVKTNSNVSLDGQSITDLFSMIHRQIDVLHYYSQTHDSKLSAVLGQMNDVQEKYERENAKLHDRVDRVMRLFEQQFSNSALEERLASLESKINQMEGQMQLSRPSPVQQAVQSFQEQKEIYDTKIAELETLITDHVNSPHNLPSLVTTGARKRVSIMEHVENSRRGSMATSRSSISIADNIQHQVRDGQIQAVASKFAHHVSNFETSSPIGDRSIQTPFLERAGSMIVKRATKNSHNPRVNSNFDAIPENMQNYFVNLEDKLESAVENAFRVEERVIKAEGGIISLDTRLKQIDSRDTKEQTAALIAEELRDMKIRLSEALDKKIHDVATQKADLVEVRGKADLSLVLKKADEIQVRRLNDLVKDLDRKVLLLTRDFEEGIETVQKKGDKKLEFMSQWIMKQTKKNQVSKETPTLGETADIGKTKCLVCDQPVRNMEKETPYSTQAFKPTFTEQKDVKRAMKLSNSAARFSNTTATANGNNKITTTPIDPATLDPDGPWQQRTFFTGGSTLGQTLAMQNNTSYGAFSPLQDSPGPTPIRVTGTVHVPSKVQRDAVYLGSPSPVEISMKPDASNGLAKSDSFTGFTGAKRSSRPSSAPAVRKDKARNGPALDRVFE